MNSTDMNMNAAMDWIDEGTFEGGTSFGDHQAADEVTRRFVRRMSFTDGTWAVIDVLLGPSVREHADGEYEYYVDEMIISTRCTDPSDPGGTEVTGNIEYGEGSYRVYDTLEEAQEEARRLASTWTAHDLFWAEERTT